MDQPQDRLVLRAQAGDPVAFDALLRQYERPLYSHVYRLVGDSALSYEILQDTYLAIVRSIRKLRSRSAFRAWAYGVATRTALKTLSRRKKLTAETDGVDQEPARQPLPDAIAEAREQREALRDYVGMLSPRTRSVILLHFYEELTLVEVATALELPLGTVKSRLHAGLAKLRATVKRQGDEP